MNTTMQPLVAQAQGGNSGVSLEMRSIGGGGGGGGGGMESQAAGRMQRLQFGGRSSIQERAGKRAALRKPKSTH